MTSTAGISSPDSDLDHLIVAQQNYLDQILKIWTNFKKLAIPKRTRYAVQHRLATLDTFWTGCLNRHDEILRLATTQERQILDYFITDAFASITECADEVRDSLSEVLNSLQVDPAAPGMDSLPPATMLANNPVKLPPINLPRFSGEITAWPGFRDLYTSLVASRTDLTNVQKLHYLKDSLSGQAVQILRSTDVTEANYTAAWELLKKRYENPRAIVYAYLDKFAAIPRVGTHRERDLRFLRDQAHDIYHAIVGMKRPLNLWEDQFIHTILSKLDSQTRHEWELTQREVTKFPTFAELDDYLSFRLRAFETSGQASSSENISKREEKEVKRGAVRIHQATSNGFRCFVCQDEHPLYQCPTFLSKSVHKRLELLTAQDRCFNCFRRGHRPKACPSKNVCRTCKRKHHTLVHMDVNRDTNKDSSTNPPVIKAAPDATASLPPVSERDVSNNCADVAKNYTVLPTATVLLRSTSGRSVKLRALFDQGSQATFVSEHIVQLLKPERKGVNISVSGIGSKRVGAIKQAVLLTAESCKDRNLAISITALVLPKLSSYVPPPTNFTSKCSHIESLPLADCDPYSKEPIQLIIGADYYGSFLRDGLVRGPQGTPVAQLTIFGWILSGQSVALANSSDHVLVNHIHTNDDLQASLVKFWELEEIPSNEIRSESELQCEQHFCATHARNSNGRYVVRLPFKTTPHASLGNTRIPALRMYLNQEGRLNQNPTLKQAYQEFLTAYLSLLHMERVPFEEEQAAHVSYLPHHPVLKSSSTTTKVRVVFNASFKSSDGLSLNDYLHVGPKLQADLYALILRWRSFQFVYATDLEKMFRQILIHPDDADFQRIFWRSSNSSDVASYRLLTVTYGTGSAPFLANRVLKQLATDEGAIYPIAADILRQSVYVDDVMFGSDDIIELKRMREQLCQLLRAGGFRPYKWTANHPDLLADIPDADLAVSSAKFFEQDAPLKVLGIHWEPQSDVFSFQVSEVETATTKRTFLSLVARIFDPHGWASPVTITGKVLFQRFWLLKLGWDELLSADLVDKCKAFQADLPLLNQIKIPLWTGQRPSDQDLELHGFCDASNVAYSAVVYIRIGSSEDKIQTSLLYAKTKVAPIKLQSIPRLELCGALLLARALRFVMAQLASSGAPIYCWTDSSVVLYWLRDHPSKWKTFVGNRVSAIQSTIPNASWRHVPSVENPADCASRGISSQQFQQHALWWKGPSWLSKPPSSWPLLTRTLEAPADNAELRNVQAHSAKCEENIEIAERVSSWPRLLRVIVYMFRFVNNLRKCNSSVPHLWVTAAEIESATKFWCKHIQQLHYPEVLDGLRKDANLCKVSQLRKLNLFIDADGIIRVGGRLGNSPLPDSEKFPVLLPSCRTSNLLALHAYKATLHGGPQVALRFLRQRYWVVNARSLVKGICFKCVTCTRHRANLQQQRMGDLPAVRVTPSRPFAHTGVDYTGPFTIRASKGRGIKTHKAYCVVFVCLSIRAIHLECADDATTAGFLAAFERFISRRGLPEAVYSDNGTNFVGADRELNADFKRVISDPDLLNKYASDGIEWRFIPPAAPHFGGLWEAGVKSVKYHLKRIIGNFTPTFEEFSTLLCKIEGILNSRPIAPLYDDPDSYDVLTPGHFLVGSYLKTIPKPSVLAVNENRLSRWQCVQKCMESFWKIWASDYLNSIQQRVKWQKSQPNLRQGDLVIIKNPNLPPAKWEMGRISKCFHGTDQLVRVVLVRTAHSEYKRPVTQVCKLPVDSHTVRV